MGIKIVCTLNHGEDDDDKRREHDDGSVDKAV
jgi:hypothetical protein